MSSRLRRGSGSVLGLVLAFAAAGCAIRAPEARPSPFVPEALTAATTLAAPIGDPEAELDALARVKTTPALLRRAFLELYCHRPQAAIDATAEVIYGAHKPSAHEESFARYLRALAYDQLGTPARGSFDLDRARALASDPELRHRLLHVEAPKAPDAAPAAEPSFLARAEWGAAEPNRGNVEPMGRPVRLTIHHSALYFRDTRPAASAAQIKMIQREHMQNRGYGDIGYHFLIDPSGRVWQGRDIRYQGAHASGDNNRGNIGICMLGNFLHGRGGQGPTPAQVAAMRGLVASLLQRYQIVPDRIYCHSDFKPTQCPGPLMEPVVAQMVRDLRTSGVGTLAAAAAGH